eukprot:2724362-Prorocentrum_lima.AAC.1
MAPSMPPASQGWERPGGALGAEALTLCCRTERRISVQTRNPRNRCLSADMGFIGGTCSFHPGPNAPRL